MLYRYIFIPEGFQLILRRDQHLIQILSHICLAALYLGSSADRFLYLIHKVLGIDLHFFNQLQNQAVLHCKQAV